MSCFPCFGSKKTDDEPSGVPVAQVIDTTPTTAPAVNNQSAESNEPNATENNGSRTFTFRELLMATKNFKQECLIGEGGFGKLYKGKLQSGEVVAVKHLDRNGTQGSKEFLVEVLILTLLHHPNLVKLIGYCADGDQRLMVYEYMPFGSMDTHLHGISEDKKPLNWQTRMKIASGVAQGLEYLHEKANPPVFYRDLKPADILLDEDYNPRLSGYGLAKLVNGNTKAHASPVMGTYGYCAPEFERQGELTVKSDVYSFGVILLELITGRRALDTTRPTDEQTLVTWAQPLFRDQKKFPDMADPLLEGRFPTKSLNQAIGMAAMCLQEEPSVRPLMSDVVSMLSFLEVTPTEEAKPASIVAAPPESAVNEHDSEDETDGSSSDDESDDSSVSSENDDEDHRKDQNEYIPDQSRNFEKQGSSSQHKISNPGNKSDNSSSSDDESDDGSDSSENDDEDHPKDQIEYIPNQSQKFEKQGSSSQHKMETNPGNKPDNSSSSDDESDDGSVSSENDDEDHPKVQIEYIPNQSQKFEKQGSSSQHKMEANPGNKSDNSSSSDDESDDSSVSSENDDGDDHKDQIEYIPNQSQKFEKQGSSSNPGNKSISRSENDSHDCSSHHISKSYDDNEGSIDSSSMRNSKAGWTDETSQKNTLEKASSGAPQGHVSMNLRQNSIEESQGGSINGSSNGHGRYEESFAWSNGSRSDYQLNDGSARHNSGHMSNVGLSMRQQSIPNA